MSESTVEQGDLSFRPAKRLPWKRSRLPFVGDALDMAREPLEFLTRLAREKGDVAYFSLLGQDVYLLSHPDAIEEALKGGGDDLRKDDFTRGLSVGVGQGLLTSEGEFWRRQRKLAQPAFHHHRVRAYAEVMVQHAARTAASFAGGETRDIHADMMRLTLDIVAETLFGANVGRAAHQISEALDVMMERFQGFSSMIPIWMPTPGSVRARRALKKLDDVVYGIIADRRKNPSDRGDLLSMLLAATTEEGGGMSDRQLRDEIVTLLLAGHETTALTLTYTLHLLARHPDVQQALTAEIDAVLGQRAATFADLPNLPLADAVVRESMRLYPPAWAIGRGAIRACKIAGVDCKPGTQLWMAQWVVHRDARWFPEPEAFRPERWREEAAKKLPKFAYFPFGGGPRVCIGNAFAMMEAVLLLVTLAQQVRLSAVDVRPIEFSPSVTLRPRGAVPMRVERVARAEGLTAVV